MTAFNQSRIKMFRRCQKQYSFRYDYGPDGKEMVPKVARRPLSRGTWMHALLQAHHRDWAGIETDWEETHAALTEAFNATFEEEREELGDLPAECERLFRAYLRYWGRTEDQYRVATLDDGSPGVEFVVEVPLARWKIDYPFKGRIDLLVEDREYGGLWIWDHKWVRKMPSPDERMMSPQSLMYTWALRKLGYDVRGFINNYGRTKPPTEPRVLQRGTLSVAARMDTDLDTYVRAIKRLHGDRWRLYAQRVYAKKIQSLRHRDALWFRRERFPVEPDRIKRALAEFIVSSRDIARRAKPAPRSYFYNCPFSCDYHTICVAEFQGLNVQPLIKKNYTFVGERYGEDPEEWDLLNA